MMATEGVLLTCDAAIRQYILHLVADQLLAAHRMRDALRQFKREVFDSYSLEDLVIHQPGEFMDHIDYTILLLAELIEELLVQRADLLNSFPPSGHGTMIA